MEFVFKWNLLAIAGPPSAKVLVLEIQTIVFRSDVVHHVLIKQTLFMNSDAQMTNVFVKN